MPLFPAENAEIAGITAKCAPRLSHEAGGHGHIRQAIRQNIWSSSRRRRVIPYQAAVGMSSVSQPQTPTSSTVPAKTAREIRISTGITT